MSRDDVARLESDLGAVYAEFTEAGADGKPIIQQARDMEAPVLFFKEGGLSGIQLDHHSRFDVRFGDVSVFGGHSRDILAALENANGGALFGLGAVLFAGLAVSTNGFFAGADPQGAPVFWDDLPDRPAKVVNLEMRGAYDPYLQNYAAISFKG
ncbi:MAG: hypothetical protein IPL47_03260 [Phyllobacteriaceae bacterium]|nr:hypothetical protein [Phyllobacteriaceae bacterium]